MSNYSFDYSFNINGNAISAAKQISGGVTDMSGKIKEATGIWDGFAGKIVVFNQASQFVDSFARTVSNTLAPGAALNASLADLSAISGEAGESLKTIEKYARESAKTFGGSAAQSVEAYKLLLGQLSPELAKAPKALKAMGDNVAILSKTMGGDATAAAEVLTTAMNQYGISLDDPTEASKKMAEMMNVMAAAGKEGSAELPTIKIALEQCGMAAKAAGISFEQTNAAIQVLDKAGKKGAEGGVALRNVMTTLARGRFLPKDIREELAGAGININKLGDKSLSLRQRLEMLTPVMKDGALFSKLFGRENTNAAMALVEGAADVDRYTEAITGTNTAYEQANIIMETYNEKKARVQARFDDIKISIFNANGEFGIWVETIANSLVPIAQLTPLLLGVGKGMVFLKNLDFSGVMTGVTRAITASRYQLMFLNAELVTGKMVSIGFAGNIIRAAIAVVRFATVGIFNAIKSMGFFILSLVTGGTASATFAGIASASFATFSATATTACRAVSIAIMNIPLIGWIIAAIVAIGALFMYFWKTSAKFRAVLKGLWAAFTSTFTGIWDLGKTIFSALGDLVVAVFSMDGKGIKAALAKMAGGFKTAGSNAGKAFTQAYDAEMADSEAENKKGEELTDEEKLQKLQEELAQANKDLKTDGTGTPNPDPNPNPIGGSIAGIGGSADKADKIKNINITIDQLIGKFEIHTTNLHDDVNRVKDMVSEALLGAVNDTNYAL